MKKKNPWDYNRFLKPICECLTNHKYHKLFAWTEGFSKGGYKYPNRHDFYYKCKICGYVFFNHHVNKKDLEFIKEWDKEHAKIFSED